MSPTLPTEFKKILRFTLDGSHYAVTLPVVERVVRAVAIQPLPQAPPFILGVINVQGHIIPAVDLRRRFGLPPRAAGLDDPFILARTSRRRVALVIDSVEGVHDLADPEMVPAEQVAASGECLHGLAKVQDNLVLIFDLDQFLSPADERSLDEAMGKGPTGVAP
jgi:purine-binding chemotaxis protein CheW